MQPSKLVFAEFGNLWLYLYNMAKCDLRGTCAMSPSVQYDIIFSLSPFLLAILEHVLTKMTPSQIVP